MGGPVPKPLLPLGGSTILARAVAPFATHPRVGPVAVVAADLEAARAALGPAAARLIFARGGRRRQDSVRAGLEALPACDLVLVHDAARPLVPVSVIDAVIEAAARHGAAIPVVAVPDTVKRIGKDGAVAATVPREDLRQAQTPQGFRIDILRAAHAAAARDGYEGTDDAALVERSGGRVAVVDGARCNLKITTPEDLALAESLLLAAAEPPQKAGRRRHG